MLITRYGEDYRCNVDDDGTLDTVVVINGLSFRYDQDIVGGYRNEKGELTPEGFESFCYDIAIPDYEQEVQNYV